MDKVARSKNVRNLGLKKILGCAVVVGMGVVVILFVGLSLWIGSGVREKCELARKEYLGDCVEALVAYVDDGESHSLEERNGAVWALGQLGDGRALPVLNKYYTGEPCEHDKFLCQYELRKAVGMCGGGI